MNINILFYALSIASISLSFVTANDSEIYEINQKLSNSVNNYLFIDFEKNEILLHGKNDFIENRTGAGSWMKLFIAYSALKQNVAKANELFICSGWKNRENKCWLKKGHGSIDLVQAIALSCNSYFSALCEQIDLELYRRDLEKYFGYDCDLELMKKDRIKWIDTYIKGDRTEVSPRFIQMASAITELLTSKRISIKNNNLVIIDNSVDYINQKALQTVIKGMRASGDYGTSSLFSKNFGSKDILAKTSTVIFHIDKKYKKIKYCSMICVFYPSIRPSAVIFFMAPDGFAATKAAPIGGKVFRKVCFSRKLLQ